MHVRRSIAPVSFSSRVKYLALVRGPSSSQAPVASGLACHAQVHQSLLSKKKKKKNTSWSSIKSICDPIDQRSFQKIGKFVRGGKDPSIDPINRQAFVSQRLDHCLFFLSCATCCSLVALYLTLFILGVSLEAVHNSGTIFISSSYHQFHSISPRRSDVSAMASTCGARGSKAKYDIVLFLPFLTRSSYSTLHLYVFTCRLFSADTTS